MAFQRDAIHSPAPPTLLLISQQTRVHASLWDVLTTEHYHLLEVATRDDACVLLAHEHIDAVLVDAALPSGSVACCRLLRSLVSIPLIMIAHQGDLDAVIAAMEAGATDVVMLDRPDDLRTRLHLHLPLHRARESR